MTDEPTRPPTSPPPPAQPPPPPVPPTPSVPPPTAYPVTLGYDRGVQVENWRSLVNWLLAVPHWIVLYALGIVQQVLWFLSFFTVLFTRKNPFVNVQAMIYRYQWRVWSFVLFMRNEYPPFEFTPSSPDPHTDVASVDVEEPGEMNRWLVLVKWLLVIPHLIVLAVLAIAVVVVVVVAFFAVLFTGKWPDGLRNFVIGFTRWVTRVNAYQMFLTDRYPPFSLE